MINDTYTVFMRQSVYLSLIINPFLCIHHHNIILYFLESNIKYNRLEQRLSAVTVINLSHMQCLCLHRIKLHLIIK